MFALGARTRIHSGRRGRSATGRERSTSASVWVDLAEPRCDDRPVRHLALAVTDQARSRRFYETYFRFDARPPRLYDGGVLMLYNADGFSLALGPADGPITLPPFLHFGVPADSPEAVHAFRARLTGDGIPIAEEWDEPEYVSVKCSDPDGYVVEFAWEPRTDPPTTA